MTVEAEDPKTKVSFVMEIAVALHHYGAAAHHIERVLKVFSRQIFKDGEFFITPTSISLDIETLDGSHFSRLKRIGPGGIDLTKLSLTDEVGDMIIDKSISFDEARSRLAHIATIPSTYPTWLILAAYALSSASFANLINGSQWEVLWALPLGFLSGLGSLFLGRLGLGPGVLEAVISFVIAAIAGVAAILNPSVDPKIIALSALIVLVPGLSITIALLELSTKNLVSGTARLMGAATELLTLAFGVMLGLFTVKTLGPAYSPIITQEALALPHYLVIPVASLTFAILFQCRVRDLGWVMLATLLAFTTNTIGNQHFGGGMGTFLSGVLLGFYSNAFARILGRPALTTTIPGLILLVPGSLGYKSMAMLFGQEVLLSMNFAFEMIITAVALVAGLSFGSTLLTPRRSY